MSDVTVRRLDDHVYAVAASEGPTTTNHRVTVDEDLRDTLGIPNLDEEQLVRETFAFLLEREKATEVLDEFDLGVVRQRYPDYLDEITTRLATDA